MDPNYPLNFPASGSSAPVPHMQTVMHLPPHSVFPQHPPPPMEFGGGNVASRQEMKELQNYYMRLFWNQQRIEISQIAEVKQHQLPLARIKRVMKSDEEVKMISADAPVLFAKACELFILELTLRSWLHTEESKRRTLQRNDIARAVSRVDVLDFLADLVPSASMPQEEEERRGGENWEAMNRNAEAPPQFLFPQPLPANHFYYHEP
ncbi:nuclear transcription factor Y subunit C-1-like isoform X2 [Aristolochia californica]|uniref:nuclear transcription factor Y subunit C-1-like isoform X2 n=1 Tax=Aristolochia californica TaxID=171875 RepID=UPI0035E1AC2D